MPTARKKISTAKDSGPIKPSAVHNILSGSNSTIDSEVLLREIIEAWGGATRLARDLVSEFQSAGEGGMTRQRILEMIQRLIIVNTTHDLGRALNPSDLSVEELEREATRLLGKIHNGAPSPGTT